MVMENDGTPAAQAAQLALLKQAAEGGDAEAQVIYAKILHQEFNDPAQAFGWMERAAEQRHPEGLYCLALFYLNGWNGVTSAEVGFKLMLASAEAGYAWGQVDVGLLYIKGTGTDKDLAQAAHWMSTAAATGLPIAQFEMGLLHLNGEGVQRDFLTALRWFQKAAEQHHPDAMFYPGAAVYEGSGTDKNPAQGWAIIQEALRLGSSLAQHNIQNYPDPAAAGR